MNTYRKMGPLWAAQKVYLQDELLRVNKVGVQPDCLPSPKGQPLKYLE
jgi:hypothetical protein